MQGENLRTGSQKVRAKVTDCGRPEGNGAQVVGKLCRHIVLYFILR